MPNATIRRRLLSLILLVPLAACGGNEAAPGPADSAGDPAGDRGPATQPGSLEISISPMSGTRDTDVMIRASGFRPGARVGLGLGPPESEYEVIRHVTAGSDGRVTATLNVPDWTEPGRDYLFVAQSPTGDEAISDPFRVTGPGGEGESVQLTGEITDEGVECPALRTDTGDLYTLTGDTEGLEPGDHVRVEGTVAEASICMQGTTVEVENVSRR